MGVEVRFIRAIIYSRVLNIVQAFLVDSRLSVDRLRVGQLVVVLLGNGKPDEFTVRQRSYGTVAEVEDYSNCCVEYV